jgi:cell division protein FtsB
MSGNRRRNANAVPLLSMAAWIVVCLFVGAAGLGYVAMKSQLHASGREIKALEKEIAELVVQNEVVETHISTLSSIDALRKRYDTDKTHLNGLIPITPDKLVSVDRPRKPVDSADNLSQVANRQSARQP